MFAAAAVLMMGVACQQEELPQGVGRGEALVSFKVEVPGDAVTKAIADGKNVDILYYEVYDADMKNRLAHGNKTRTAEKVFDLQLTLVQDQTYNFLFWAQVDGEDYYTVTDLRNVTVDYTDAVGNDEARAAFFAAEKFAVGKNTLTKDIYLKRPFAQLNFGTTTFKSSLDADVVVNSSVITVTKASTKFDVFAGVGSANDLAQVVFTAEGRPTDPTKLTVNPETAQKQEFEYLSMNYFFVGGEESTVGVNAVFNTTAGDVTHSIPSVPVAENFRTNIVGDLLFNTTNFKIYVDEKFNTPDNDVYFAKDAATLVSLVENANDGDEIKLMNDVELSETLVLTKDITIDGDGHTLQAPTVATRANVDGVNGRAINVSGAKKAVIKNLIVVGEGERGINIIQGTKEVVIENVKVTADNYAINVAGSAAGVKVTVSDSEISGLNAVNVGAANVVVNITDSKITCNDQTDVENYSAIAINKDGVNTKVTATRCEFFVMDDSNATSAAADGSVIELVDCTGDIKETVKYYAIEYGFYGYSFENFAGALAKVQDGETILLTRNVNENLVFTEAKNITIDGNNKSVVAPAEPTFNGLVYPNGNVTVKNLAIVGENQKTVDGKGLRAIFIEKAGSYVFENVTTTGTTYALNVNTKATVELTVKNSTLEGWTSYGGTTTATFENVTFTAGEQATYRPYGTTVLTGCSFPAGFEIDLGSQVEGATIKFVNCTYAGAALTADNLSNATGKSVTIE